MFKDRRRLAIIAGLGVIGVCIVCGLIYVLFPSSVDELEGTSVAEVQTEVTTEEVAPEETEPPTELPPPTNTPQPTNTPEPTNTPLPSATPTEVPTPTPIPDPIILTGSGDSVVDFENPFPAAQVHITGNPAGRHFAVKGHDVSKVDYELLVNTTDPYEGVVLIDPSDTHTTRFEVTGSGEWTIVVDSLQNARRVDVPGSIDGIGDDVIFLVGGTPDLALIKGNEGSHHFSVKGYGSSRDLLVNTTDPYEGTVILASDTLLFEINVEGPWSIEVTPK